MTSATRNLCVGAYIDKRFRSRVLRDVYAERRRALAPSYGFDAVAVLLHCRRAHALTIGVDIVICVCLAFMLRSGLLNLLGVVLLLVLWGLVVYLGRMLAALAGLDRERRIASPLQTVTVFAVFVALLTWYVDSLLPGLLDSLTQWSDDMQRSGQVSDAWFGLGQFASPTSGKITFWTLVLFLVVAVEGWRRQVALEYLALDRQETPKRRLTPFVERQNGNVTMYSGYSPFLGAGQELRTWSFALRVSRIGGGEYDAAPFNINDLLGHVREQLTALSLDSRSTAGLAGLTVQDHVFHDAQGADRLTYEMTAPQVRRVVADPTTAARHYLVCQVVSWDGEVVTTVFVHVALQGRTLYLEFSAWMLPPTRSAFQMLRDSRNVQPTARFTAVSRALAALPGRVLLAPFGLLRLLLAVTHAALSTLFEVSAADYDFGARTSIRELGAMPLPKTDPDSPYVPDNYFQSRDVVKYWKIVERRLIAAIFDFLHAHGVDTTEYTDRAVTVLNTGVMQFGGRMEIRGSAIGTNASTGRRRRRRRNRQ